MYIVYLKSLKIEKKLRLNIWLIIIIIIEEGLLDLGHKKAISEEDLRQLRTGYHKVRKQNECYSL